MPYLPEFLTVALVAVTLSHGAIKSRVAPIQQRLERIFGAILIALGLKVGLSSSE